MKHHERYIAAICLTFTLCISGQAAVAGNAIILQSTTSTKNSGLYDHLLPIFKKHTGITVYVVAVGTGQAIRNAKQCDGDVLLVHAKAREQKFVASGYGVNRFDLMYNDFIIVGPPSDPAGVSGLKNAAEAMRKFATQKVRFASRSDNSGTHIKEMALWRIAKVDPVPFSGGWYRELGSGMGTTLNVGVGMNAYVLTDRATWLTFKNKLDFKILVEGDKALFNQYGVILVNKAKCPNVKAARGEKFVNWLISSAGQRAIGNYRIDGQQLFFPNAN